VDKNKIMSQQPEEEAKEKLPSSGDPKFDALRDALIEKKIAWAGFMGGDEGFRKRALKDDYQKMKDEHKWLYDQPINPKTKEEQEEEKAPAAATTTTKKA